MQVSCETVELPNGQVVDDFYNVDLRNFALIIPVMEDGRVLLLRQYKHGPRRVSVTFPAGFVEEGEPALDAAQRELLEETGCVARTWQPLGSFVDNGNQQGSTGHYFLAHGCRRIQEPESGDLEEMQEEFWTMDEIDKGLLSGAFAISHNVSGWGLARIAMAQT